METWVSTMSTKARSQRGQRDDGSLTECPIIKILIAFYSRNGSTESLAKAVAEGGQAAGAEVRLRRARELVSEEVMKAAPGWLENARRMNAAYEAPTTADAEWADGIILGTPPRFGSVTSALKAWIDGLGGRWATGAANGQGVSAFSSWVGGGAGRGG